MPMNAQLQAETDQQNQAMAERTRVPTNLPKFTGKRGEDVRKLAVPGIAGSAMEKPASGCFLHWSSTTGSEDHTWGIFREHVLQHFEASNYQAVLREKLQRIKQTADIETYNGEYSALIFRVECMSTLDQVLHYANGLKPRTRSYVKLENPETLSAAMDLAIKYEVTHFVDELRDRQSRQDKRKISTIQAPKQDNSSKGKPFRGKGRFKPRSDSKRTEDRTCYHCKNPCHIMANCFIWNKEQEKQGNGQPCQ
ncbi:unnamed protein product [Phytophthora fragariaefolia]|uniref:Unnamed protein product n=1 Tax=Phytophthora fragariaefolia TaxID=1490495 RepID=A0A9W7CZ80_9STRA|nr:unnamed protein product [Phytophthora fragariaefolia]